MKITDLMLREIRAEIEFGEEKIIVKNPKGEIRKELLEYIYKNIIEQEKHDELETIELLMTKLTNIEIEKDTIVKVLNNPCAELNRVLFYLNSIQQELVFEVIALRNLEIRAKENTVLEEDSLKMIMNIQNVIKEVQQRDYIKNHPMKKDELSK